MARERTTPLSSYQVLELPGPDSGWREVGEPIEAGSAEQAIKERAGEEEGTYRAVPARYWGRPLQLTTTKRTVVKLNPAPETASGGGQAAPGVASEGDGEAQTA